MKGGCNIDIKDGITLMNEYGEYMDVDKVDNMCTDCIQQTTCKYIINCLREGLYQEVLDAKAIIYEEKKKTEEFKEQSIQHTSSSE